MLCISCGGISLSLSLSLVSSMASKAKLVNHKQLTMEEWKIDTWMFSIHKLSRLGSITWCKSTGESFCSFLILRVWESLSVVTCCRSLVILYDSICILQIGMAAESSAGDGEAMAVDATKLMQGSLYQGVMKSEARKQLDRILLSLGMFYCLLCQSIFRHL